MSREFHRFIRQTVNNKSKSMRGGYRRYHRAVRAEIQHTDDILVEDKCVGNNRINWTYGDRRYRYW